MAVKSINNYFRNIFLSTHNSIYNQHLKHYQRQIMDSSGRWCCLPGDGENGEEPSPGDTFHAAFFSEERHSANTRRGRKQKSNTEPGG